MAVKAAGLLHLHYWNAYEDVLRNIKICDPACGSGAFLNQCFDYLREEMDFVLDMKYQFDPQPSFFDIDKQILQNNLFGVDINPESVEITKLSLWLKTAKNNQTLATLDGNIKCGNSIVACKEVAENAFDWQREFADVFSKGGFDIVVGNPPYGAKLDKSQKDYLTSTYITTEYNYDTYKTFFELGMNIAKEGGYLGYITPNTYFSLELGANKLRHFLFSYTLCRIVELFNVFPSAIVEPVITIYRKQEAKNNETFTSICLPRGTKLSSTFLNEGVETAFVQADLRKNDQLIFNYRSTKQEQSICDCMDCFQRLDTMFDVMTGAKPYQVGKGVPPQTKEIVDSKPFTNTVKLDDTWVPYMRGKYIDRFVNAWENNPEYIKYGEWLAEPRLPAVFEGEKLFIRQTGDSLIAMFDSGNVSNNTLHSIYPLSNNESVGLIYLMGLLNSTLLNWYYKKVHYLEVGKPMAEVKGIFLKKLPIAVGDDLQMETVQSIVSSLVKLCKKRFDIKLGFIHYLKSAYEPKKVTQRMEEFDRLTFKEFCAELKKQKVKLSAAAQIELLPLFDQKKTAIAALTAQIRTLQSQLDDEVFNIYGISSADAEQIRNEMLIEI